MLTSNHHVICRPPWPGLAVCTTKSHLYPTMGLPPRVPYRGQFRAWFMALALGFSRINLPEGYKGPSLRMKTLLG